MVSYSFVGLSRNFCRFGWTCLIFKHNPFASPTALYPADKHNDASENLRSAIIKNNRNLLNGKLPSYDRQIKKAQERGDIVSVNHIITAFLESYFDVIFALNRQTHPGEKRQVQLCKKYCTLLPKDFEENINALMKSISDGGSYEIVTAMVNNLDEILNDEFK